MFATMLVVIQLVVSVVVGLYFFRQLRRVRMASRVFINQCLLCRFGLSIAQRFENFIIVTGRNNGDFVQIGQIGLCQQAGLFVR